MGRNLGVHTRLRVSRALSSRLLEADVTYIGAGGFAFAIDNDDQFQAAMLMGLYDPLVEAVLRRRVRPGGIVIDAGAHLGYFSLRLARWVGASGAVHAFECDPRLLQRLRRHVEINELPWITVNACGLLDAPTARAPLYLPSQLGWASTIEGAWGATEAVTVEMVTLDAYVREHGLAPERLSLIKLDVEGSELQALIGAQATLAATAAPVLVEFIPERMRAVGQEPDDLLTLMDGLGFEPFSPLRTKTGRIDLVPGAAPQTGDDLMFLKRGQNMQCSWR